MRSLGHLLGQVRNRVPKQRKRPSAVTSASRFSASFEPLEQRRLLAANILASLDGNLLVAGDTNQIQLEVAGSSAVIGFRMGGTGGTLDPDAVVIKDMAGHTIAPILAWPDANGAKDSLVLSELSPGSYTITTRAEGLTSGSYHLEAFLPGDQNGDGMVDQNELRWAQAATIQSMGSWNFVTQQYYASFGIDLTKDLYREELDCDLNGTVNGVDLSAVTTNASGALVSIQMVGDSDAPVIQAGLLNDTGVSDSDGISRDVTIAGTVTDDSAVASFIAGIDGMDRSEYVSLLGQLDAAGVFVLDLAQLEAIAGVPLANTGAHSLFLVAADEFGNESDAYEVVFELDTIAPAAPTNLDLIAASDLGFFDDDNITSDNTPTFVAVGEASARFILYYRQDGFGDPIALNSPASSPVTSAVVPDGTHDFTITAVDLAGNASEHSAALIVTIDTAAPQVPTLDLAAADDTGVVGDQYTSNTNVTLEGVAEAGSRVTLNGTATTHADGTTGEYHFADVPLAFGPNAFTVVSMDVAGNTSSVTRTITQNDAPVIGTTLAPIDVNEDPGTVTRSLATLFSDANLAAGDVLTLSVVGNTNPTLVTPSLSGTTGQVVGSQLGLQFGANQHGSAVLTIRATDSYGETVDSQIVVNVAPLNDPPVFIGTGMLQCDENSFVEIDLRGQFTDVETPVGELTFELIAGSEELGVAELLPNGHTIRFTPHANVNGLGQFKVKVTDTGDAGAPAITVEQIFFVNIAAINDPPIAQDGHVTTDEDETVVVDLWELVSDTETPDDELTFAVGGAQHGTVALVGNRYAHFTPVPDYSGPASFNYTVTDTGDGDAPAETSGATVYVTVVPVNDPPEANTLTATIDENQTLEVDLHDLVSDKETADADLVFEINSMTGGTAVLQDGHRVVFIPTAHYNGPAGFTYSVTDQKVGDDPGQEANTVGPVAVTININPINSPPVAGTTTVTTLEDTPTTEINLRELVFDQETPDAELIFRVGNAQNGTVVLIDGYKAVFTPAQDYNGQTTFAYWAKDTGDNGAPAIETGPITITVNVTPVNDAPVAVNDVYGVRVDGQLTVAAAQGVLANDYDVDGDALTADLVAGVQHGTLTFNADGSFSYTPNAGFSGVDTFTYLARDYELDSAVATVTIHVTENNPPNAVDDSADTDEDTPISGGSLLDNDTDDDGDPLTVIGFEAVSAYGAAVTVDAAGFFTYDPTVAAALQALPVGAVVEDTFTYTISDGRGGEDTATVTVTVTGVNDAPTATDVATETMADNILGGNSLLTGASDIDAGDTENLFVNVGLSATVSELGAGVSISANGNFLYDPTSAAALKALAAGETTVDRFHFVVDDGNGGQVTAEVIVTVTGVNDAPVAVGDVYSVDEDATLVVDAANGVLANDTDVDGDALNAILVTGTQHGTLTLSADGSFTYTPDADFHGTDTFTYRASDASLESNTATVTITVNPVNDAPVAVDDSYEAAVNGQLTVSAANGVLANDTDVDGDVLTAVLAQGPQNGTLTLNANGSFTYTPNAGFDGVDTFTYRASDGDLQSNVATVTITLSWSNRAPQLDNPIADLVLTDSSSPRTTVIDLSTVFSDPDDDALTYTATSSNTGLVTVAIDGSLLSVTYVNYGTPQDRTPANITVTAKDPSNETATDSFVVTVNPEETVGMYVVILDTATPAEDTTADALPSSITEIDVGSSYVVEIWIQDTYDSTVSGGPSQGISASLIDIAFNKNLSEGTAKNYEGAFFSSGAFDKGEIKNDLGLVDDFGAGTMAVGVALSPNYSRVGYVTFDASAAGVQVFNLSDPVVARFASGDVNQGQIGLHGASINQVAEEPLTFTITEQDLRISGVLNGAELAATPAPAFRADDVTGEIHLLVDDLDTPTKLMVTGGTADVAPNFAIGPVRPGIGGTDSATWGDFAFEAGAIELAIRDFILDFSSGWVSMSGGFQFEPDEIVIGCDTGFIDMRSPVTGGERVDLTGLTAVPSGNPKTGYLWSPDASGHDYYELQINYERIIDISSLSDSIDAGSFLRISGVLTATYYPDGAPLVGSESAPVAETGTGVYMTLAKEPTMVSAGGQIATLPQSEAWIHEWNSYWVEVWVATDEAAGVEGAKVDLSYNPNYFTATQIDHAGTFNQAATGSLKTDGVVVGLGGNTTLAGMGSNGYALLGRVKFESIGDDGVDINLGDLVLGPHDLGLALANASVLVGGEDVGELTVGRAPKTELWAVPFDVDDNGVIGPGDLSFFAAAYGETALDSASPFVQAFDFDNNGAIGPGDLSFFAANYGATRGGEKSVVLPESFVQRYIGAGLEVQGQSSVGEVLDAAVAAWTSALGIGEPIAIQLVVKDFGSAQLAEAVILDVNEFGVPTSGRITLDDDAAGLGWHSDLDSLPDGSQYDLYTVLLHEIGHTLGFTTSYDAFAEHLDVSGDATVFVGAAISVEMDRAANHVSVNLLTGDSLEGDLMSKTLSPGVRKSISTLDVRMLHAAYQTAGGGEFGYTGESAALTGSFETTPADLAAAVSTAEIDPRREALEGDVTWDRLLTRPLRNDLERPIDAVFADTLFDVEDRSYSEATDDESRREAGDAANARPEGDWFELAAKRTSDRAEDDAADVLLSGWNDWSV